MKWYLRPFTSQWEICHGLQTAAWTFARLATHVVTTLCANKEERTPLRPLFFNTTPRRLRKNETPPMSRHHSIYCTTSQPPQIHRPMQSIPKLSNCPITSSTPLEDRWGHLSLCSQQFHVSAAIPCRRDFLSSCVIRQQLPGDQVTATGAEFTGNGSWRSTHLGPPLFLTLGVIQCKRSSLPCVVRFPTWQVG